MRREETTIQQSPLPSGYRRLEYIQCTGTQRITIPNYYPSTDSLFKCRIKYANNNDISVIFQVGTNNNRFMLVRTNVSGRYDYAVLCPYSNKTGIAVTDWQSGIWHDIEITYNRLTINGHDYTLNGVSGNVTKQNHFNIASQNWGSYGYCPLIINSFEVLSAQGDINLLSALRENDSKPGMYDIVNNTFYTNAGTGEFLYA